IILFAVPSSANLTAIMVNHGPWTEILENWITLPRHQFNNSRVIRAMKIDDKILTVSKISPSNKRDVSETDLYLLSMIYKIFKKIQKKKNQFNNFNSLIYSFIMSSFFLEPCPTNYTRMGQNCYHFSNRDFDWKSSGSLCRGMGGHLVEFNTVEENQDVIAGIMSNSKFKGNNFWTGGLNPGLLWIWANSARPVQQDTKQTVIGDGRCLKLTFNASSKLYSYRGEDCSSRQKYICELTIEDESANRIERTARLLIDKSD
ncbi:Oxidized low-density lipoprotein receptor 1, partial [Atta colombica]